MALIPPIRGELFPPPAPVGDLSGAWRSAVARVVAEANQLGGAIAAARGRGAGLGNGAGGARVNLAQARAGVGASQPGHELHLANVAASGKAGANAAIVDAERNAFDPRAPVPHAPTGNAEGPAASGRGHLAGHGGSIRGASRQADREVDEGRRI